MSHYNLVHKSIPRPQTMKILDAKTAVDKAWDMFQELASMAKIKSKSKQEVLEQAQKNAKQ